MKKLLVLFFLALMPSGVYAFSSQGGENITVSLPINDDFYAAGNRVEVSSTLSGDLVGAGGMVIVNGAIQGDLIAAGGTIEVNGNIGDDARLAGGNIIIRGTVNDDLVVAGGNIEIRKWAIINGDLIVTGGSVIMEGTVRWQLKTAGGKLFLNGAISGNADIVSENITTGPDARIAGNLEYTGTERNNALESITTGTKNLKQVQKKDVAKGAFAFISAYLLYKILFLTLFGFILAWVFEKHFRETVDILTGSPWKSFFVGLGFFLLMPMLILLSFILIITIPFGFLFMAIYIFAFVFYELLCVAVFATWTDLYFRKGKKNVSVWWRKLGFVLLFAILFALISGIDIIAAWFVLWAMLIQHYFVIQTFRK